jgi:hypothetical protein
MLDARVSIAAFLLGTGLRCEGTVAHLVREMARPYLCGCSSQDGIQYEVLLSDMNRIRSIGQAASD